MNLIKKDSDYKWLYTRIYNSLKIMKYINIYGDDYDVVHYHGVHSLFMDFLKIRTPVISTLHGIFPACIANWGVDQWCEREPSAINCSICTSNIRKSYKPFLIGMMLYSSFYYSRMKSSLEKLDKVISVSNYVGNIVKNAFHLQNIVNIYNFIDIEKDILYNLKEDGNLNNTLNLDEDDKIILFSGGLVRKKGIHVLIKSFEKISKDDENVFLVITGIGPMENYIRKMSEENKRIIYLGFTPRSLQIKVLSRSSVFAAPSTYPDACPTTILEAMALGVPVVSTRLGGIPELVVDGRTGYLVEPNDPDALSRGILKVLSRDQDGLEENCIDRAKKFDITQIGPDIIALYHRLSKKG